MKATLKPGLTHRFCYTVPERKTVPFTYPESPEIASMPKGFATGFMIVLMEWTCIQLSAPHLDAGNGRHRRFIAAWDKFKARVADKAKAAGVA